MSYIGIDLHTNRFTAAWLTVEEEELAVRKATYTLDKRSLDGFLGSLQEEDYVLIENTTNAFWFHDRVCERVQACYVYDTNHERSDAGNKTDKIDAEKLAKKLGYYVMMKGDREDLPTVYVPEVEVRELRGLLRTYQGYKGMKTQRENRIHSILKQNGICLQRNQIGNQGFDTWLKGIELGKVWMAQIHILLKGLETDDACQKEIKDMIILKGSKLFGKEIELLLSIKGFSVFTAVVLMGDVVDINRFRNVKRFCSYLRTAPRTKSSNEKTHVGAVNRKSRSMTCTVLTQAVVHFGKIDPHISEFYGRVKVGKSAGKARIAVIRKILVCAYHMLKRNKRFRWVSEEMYERKLKQYHREVATLTRRAEEVKKIA